VENKRIMLVEDDIGIREMTRKYLKEKGYYVIIAESGEQALRKIDSNPPDLILLDIELPGKDGFEVCKAIREKLLVPIIFLSVRREIADKVKGLELGGDDYLTKPFKFIELEARIKANLRWYQSKASTKRNIVKHDELEIDLNNYTCYLNNEPVTLSAKEMELLIHLATSPNQVWSHEQLYNQIWALESTSDISTVKVHISRLRRKLEKDQANPKFIKTVRGFGYQFVSSENDTTI